MTTAAHSKTRCERLRVVIAHAVHGSQNLPLKQSPHCLVDMVTTHNAVKTERFVHLVRHILRTYPYITIYRLPITCANAS